MTVLLRIVFPLLALVIAGSAQGQQTTRTPSELVRALRAVQDRITSGDTDAHLIQRRTLTEIAEAFAAVDVGVWKEPANARAAVAFVLSGGTPTLLRKLLGENALPATDEKLAQGVLAYGEGHDAEALERLSSIDARALDASLAGHIALAQAELIAKSEPKKALEFLDDARLLSPGTLIEEAALRRQVDILAAVGDLARFETLASTYLRRFPRSVYAGAFRHQFAVAVAARGEAVDATRTARLQASLEGLDIGERRDVYLAIALEALTRGKVALVRFAAQAAAPLFEKDSEERLRASLYEAAALVATEEADKALATLAAIGSAGLDEEDAELSVAATTVAAEIRRMPAAADASAAAASPDAVATFKAVGMAHTSMARADQLLSETSK